MTSQGTETIAIEEARREIAGGDALAVDVRPGEEWGEGHVPGAIHLPGGESAEDRLQAGSRLMVIAGDGRSAAQAAGHLSDLGYDAVAVDGDMDDWISADFNVQPTADPAADSELGAG